MPADDHKDIIHTGLRISFLTECCTFYCFSLITVDFCRELRYVEIKILEVKAEIIFITTEYSAFAFKNIYFHYLYKLAESYVL